MTVTSFSTVIVTYNSANDILDLLADLHAHVPDGKTIVIDNASRDRTAQLVGEHYPNVRVIRNSSNVGYARAVNQGFDLCDSEYVLLLNPDIRILGRDVFRALETCLRKSRRIAAAAPLQFMKNEMGYKLNFTWSYLTMDAFRIFLTFRLHQKKEFCDPIPAPYLNAGCLFMRRSAFYQVGKLSEKYFMYGEEPDLFLKFKRYGFECYLLPQVKVIHYRERSLSTVPTFARLRIRWRAILNIIDAFTIGWMRILLDKLALQRGHKLEED